MSKIATLILLLASAMLAQGIAPLRTGQPEIFGSATVTHARSLTKAGFMVDGGVLVHPNFAIIGEYSYTPVAYSSSTFNGVRSTSSARFHNVQAGGRVNILSSGRVIPYLAGTVGLLRLGASGPVNASGNRFGFGVGGGIIVRATRHVDFKVDFRGLRGKDVGYWITRGSVGVGYRF